MKGRSGRALDASINAEKAVERRKGIICENQVNFDVFESGHELGASLGAGYLTDEMIGFKQLLNELRVTGVVLQQQNSQRSLHVGFLMLPGGGSLMTAQKTPSSLTALTNS